MENQGAREVKWEERVVRVQGRLLSQGDPVEQWFKQKEFIPISLNDQGTHSPGLVWSHRGVRDPGSVHLAALPSSASFCAV